MAEKGTFTSALGKGIEQVLRPSHGMNTAIQNLVAASKGTEEFKPLKSFKEGFSLRDKTTGGDILEEFIGSTPDDAGMGEKIARGVGGFALDVFFDPLTLVGIGPLTKVGKAAKMAKGLKTAKTLGLSDMAMSQSSKLAERIAGITAKRGPEAAILGENLAEQGARGQRALLTFAGESMLPTKVNKAVFNMASKAGLWMNKAPIIGDFIASGKTLFNTKTGNEMTDLLAHLRHGKMTQISKVLINEVEGVIPMVKHLSKEEQNLIQKSVVRGDTGHLIDEAGNIGRHGRGEIKDIISQKVHAEETTNMFNKLSKTKKGSALMHSVKELPVPHQLQIIAKTYPVMVANLKTTVRNKVKQGLKRPERVRALVAVKAGVKPGEMTPELLHVAEKTKAFLKKLADVEVEMKIIKEEIDGYLPAVASKDVMKMLVQLQKKSKLSPNEFNETVEFAKEKILTRHLTMSEANNLVKSVIGDIPVKDIKSELIQTLNPAQIASLEGIRKVAKESGAVADDMGDFFVNDLEMMLAVRGVRHAKAVSQAQFVDGIKAMKTADGLPVGLTKVQYDELFDKDYDVVKGFQTTDINGLQGLHFPKNVAEGLNRYNKMMIGSPELNDFVKNYKEVINFWKKWTLSIFPEYHSRNIIGNVSNNWVTIGMSNPKWYIRAAGIQRKPSAMKVVSSSTGEVFDGNQVIKQMEQLGVLDSGQFTHEAAGSVAEANAKISWNPKDVAKSNFAPLKAGRKVGETFENNAKIAHYINRIEEGFSQTDAAMSVKEALFDYSDLTSFEKDWMRFAFPFYSWSRKNIPLQVKNAIMQPEKYSRIGKAKNELEQQQDTQDTNLNWIPEWMQDTFPLILEKLPEAERYKVLLLTSWLPAGDIDRLFRPKELLLGSVEPISKEFFQQISNKDFYLDRDIEKYPGEMTSIWGIDISAKWRHVLRNIRLVNWVDQMNPGGVFGKYEGEPSIFGAKRRIIDLPAKDRIRKSLTGFREHPYDVRKGKKSKKWGYAKEIGQLKWARKKSIRSGDTKNLQKITERLRELNILKRTGG
jgi:hypothetical protein